MKLHGAIKLGSTSVLLNNIDKYVKRGQIRPFWPLKKDLFGSSLLISTLPGKLYAKIEKKLLNSFGANGLQVQKEQNLTLPTLIWPYQNLTLPYQKMTFRAIQQNRSFDIYVTPKRLHAKKEEKLL